MIYYYVNSNDNILTIETPEDENKYAPLNWRDFIKSKVDVGIYPIAPTYKEFIRTCLYPGAKLLWIRGDQKTYLRTLFKSKEEAEKLIKEFYIKDIIE
jgi:hypothetical protein